MYYIMLNNGSEYAANWCGVSSGVLNIQIATDETLLDVAEEFSQTNATEKIFFRHGETDDEFEGYTRPILVQDQRWQGGGMLIQMIKEAAQNG